MPDTEINLYKTLFNTISLTVSDLLSNFPHLAQQYKQLRITKVTATLDATANFNTKAQIGFAVIPDGFANVKIANISDIDTLLSAGTVVVKQANRVQVASWVPTQPDDYDYSSWDLDSTGRPTGDALKRVICNAVCIYRGYPSDLLVRSIVKQSDGSSRYTFLAGTITWDFQVTLRGTNSLPAPKSSKIHLLQSADVPSDFNAFGLGKPIVNGDNPALSENSV